MKTVDAIAFVARGFDPARVDDGVSCFNANALAESAGGSDRFVVGDGVCIFNFDAFAASSLSI